MTRLYQGIAPSSRVIIIISLQIKSTIMESSNIYKSITAILSLGELLCSALEITVQPRENYSLFSCFTVI